MLIVQVNDVAAEAAQTLLTRFDDIIRTSVDGALGVDFAEIAEFGRNDGLIPFAFQRDAEQILVAASAISIGTVQKRAPELYGAVQCFRGFCVVTFAIGCGHAHAAEAKGRNTERTQFSLLHDVSSLCRLW